VTSFELKERNRDRNGSEAIANPNNNLSPNLDPHLDSCILAAIDIGTNSVHMVIVRVDKTLPAFTIIAREKATVRLGERESKSGKLTEESMKRAIAALKRCHDLAQSFNVDHLIAVATSATREAPNGNEFLEQIQREVGITVDLISGYEEARRIYLGVLSGVDFQNQPHVIIDIGGGSTEFILADSHEPRFLSSTKVGAVRLTREFITSDPITPVEFAALCDYIRGTIERPVDELRSLLSPSERPRLIGTSGTIETLAALHALEKSGEVPSPLQGYEMSRKDIREMVKRFSAMGYAERSTVPGLSDKRAEIIVAGAVILQEAMTMLRIETITICERALREGMIVDWMLNHGLIEDRLRFQSEIRQRSVMNIARKYKVDLPYSERIANFALSLFDQTQGILHYWGEKERNFLWAAAILHNCGLYISHGFHHKHSYYLIRHAELLGFTEVELEIVASIARYHRKSKPKKRHETFSKLSEEHQLIIRQLSAILRIAVALDRRNIGAIQSIRCQYVPSLRQLHLHLYPSHDDDDCALELWNLEFKKGVFEEEFNLAVMIALVASPLPLSL
jgi:exopolyphosphatase/guanosine-5'-triphosphate,3'-diphosphate pyrophosphatase